MIKGKKIPAVRSVMTPFPYTIDVDEGIGRAKAMLAEHDIRHLPVTKQGRLVGVITERDIRRALDPVFGLPSEDELTVRHIFIREAYIVKSTEPLDSVLLGMAARRVGSALIVKGEKLAGIFTVTDACRSFGEFLRSQFPRAGDDEAA